MNANSLYAVDGLTVIAAVFFVAVLVMLFKRPNPPKS